MKTKLFKFLTLSFLVMFQWSFAQMSVSGTVSDEDGVPLPGATVLVVGTTNGVTTDFDGNYSIMANEGDVLSASYVGYNTVESTVGSASTINFTLSASTQLDEVVVSGVAGATSRKKLSVTVASLSAEDIEAVPASSASGALLGKVAGVSISNLGRPGSGSTIILRGAANFYGTQEPLIILDGVFVEGGLDDINVDDIASFEIVKGASASALYGSRAGNGVIVISTKRGKIGKTSVTFRSETGFNKITNYMTMNMSHGWELASDWESAKGTYTKLAGITYPAGFASVYAAGGAQATIGARSESADNFADNPYGVYNDFQDLFFVEGITQTNYISMSSGTEKARSLFSFEDYRNEGVMAMIEGYKRQSYRMNLDYDLSDKLKFSTSNVFVMINDKPGLGGSIFRTSTRLSPDANVTFANPDGSPYWYLPDPHESEIANPLYSAWNYNRSGTEIIQNKFLGSYNLNYVFSSSVNAEVEYSFESNDYNRTSISPYDTYTTTGDTEGFGYSKGSMTKYNFTDLAQKLQATVNYAGEFGLLDVKAKASYLIEDRSSASFTASGNDFLYKGLPTLDNFDSSTISINSNTTTVRAQNYFAIVGFVWDDKFILDGLYRKDGSSLFGANEKWNDYYRGSAAYRISEDFSIPGVDELKINVAVGTSGQRPGFSWQYQQVPLSNGSLSSNRLAGNPDLVPSLTTEKEVGLNAVFAGGKLTLEAAYSNQLTDDQFMLVSLFAPANAGKNGQWQNVGDLEADTIEAQLNLEVMNTDKFTWDFGINYSSTDAKINKLNAPKQQVGSDGLFLLQEGTEWGSMWGRKFVSTLDEMSKQLPAGASVGDYSVNVDGIVVKTSDIGTPNEAGIIMRDGGASGNPSFVQIGNQTADFRVGMTSNMSFGDFDLYMLWDWKQGGDIYNRNTQWNTISERSAIVDQAGKPDGLKKTRKYYGSLYDVNDNNGFWVEDGSFLKLRELAVTWDFSDQVTSAIPGLSSAKLSLIGRNILTITDYTGWDPEVTNYSSGVQQYFSVDYGVYPTQSTYSLSLKLNF